MKLLQIEVYDESKNILDWTMDSYQVQASVP